MLEACSRAPSVAAVVVASSGAVYEPATRAHEEGDALGPTDIYGSSKDWTERLATYFHGTTGTPVGIARIFNVIGPGETNPHLLPAIIEQIREGRELRLGNLSTRRDYVFSGDVADGLARLADGCREAGVLTCNLGSESAVSGAELVELVASAAGREVSITRDPRASANRTARCSSATAGARSRWSAGARERRSRRPSPPRWPSRSRSGISKRDPFSRDVVTEPRVSR